MAKTTVKNGAEITHRQKVLNKAFEAVLGDRQTSYGSPEDNFDRITALWNAYMNGRAKPFEEQNFAKHEVAILHILTRIGRLSHTPAHMDSWSDIAGYAACGAEVAEKDSKEI